MNNPPSGTQTKKLPTLTTWSQRISRIFASSKLNHYHIGIYLKTYLLPTLLTSLACSHLSTSQYNSVQQQYTSLAISSLTFNKTWPNILRYGNHQYCGIQLKYLESEALIRKISHLRILHFKPHTSQLVLVILAWYQHVSEHLHPLLKQHPFTMHHINSLWFNDLVRLLKKYNVELKLQDTVLTKYQRQNNRYIMNDILTNISSTTSRKKIACRLYLQVPLLSDITDSKDITLLNNVLIDSRSKNRHHTSSCTLKEQINIHSGNLWNRTLRCIYCQTTSSPRLKQHFYLQHWYTDRHIVHRYQYSPTEYELYEFHQMALSNGSW